MARRVVGVRLAIDEETDGQRSELPHGREDRARIRRVVPAVDEHDSFLGEDDAGIGIEVLSDVDVDPVLELPDLRAQVLGGGEGDGEERDEDREGPCRFEFHGAPLTCCLRPDVAAVYAFWDRAVFRFKHAVAKGLAFGVGYPQNVKNWQPRAG